jgi:hypothetical protein
LKIKYIVLFIKNKILVQLKKIALCDLFLIGFSDDGHMARIINDELKVNEK